MAQQVHLPPPLFLPPFPLPTPTNSPSENTRLPFLTLEKQNVVIIPVPLLPLLFPRADFPPYEPKWYFSPPTPPSISTLFFLF